MEVYLDLGKAWLPNLQTAGAEVPSVFLTHQSRIWFLPHGLRYGLSSSQHIHIMAIKN